MNKLVALIVVASSLACASRSIDRANQPTLDGSSADSMKASMEIVARSLAGDERGRFADAFTSVVYESAGVTAFDSDHRPALVLDFAWEFITPDVALALDGKTAAEVVALADHARVRRESVQDPR